MALISKSSDADPTATHWSIAQHSFEITEENPKYETDDRELINLLKSDPQFEVDDPQPEPAADAPVEAEPEVVTQPAPAVFEPANTTLPARL